MLSKRAARAGRFTRFTLPALAALFACSAAAAAPGEVFTPDHVARLRMVSAAEISPDGQRVAYVLSVPRDPFKEDDGPAWGELHVITPDGTSRPFITGEVSIGAIGWMPDSSAITFLAKRGKDKNRTLYMIPVDGGEARKLVGLETDIQSYSLSGDGRRAAVVAEEKEDKDKKKLADRGFNQNVYEEDGHPPRLWIVELGNDDAKPRLVELPGVPGDIRWAPSGTQIALTMSPTPQIDDVYMRSQLHVVDADSGEVVARFANPGKLGGFAWSPDAQRLGVLSAEDLHDPSAGRLMVASVTERSLADILPGYEGEVTTLAWQDDETLMFIGDESVWSTFGEIGFDGTNRKTHIPTGRMTMQGFSLSRDGQSAAILADSPFHPTEVFLMRHGDTAPRRMTDSNPWLADLRFAKQEVISYAARDGLTIEGVLVRPLDEEAGRRYPLILTVHGGPEAHEQNGFKTHYGRPGQVAAARGFAVFYPNYRGSTARGVAFSKLGQADYGGKEFDDLVDAVDHLVEAGLVDKDKVGVTGGSYGGYATAWCATKLTERFAAGVMFVGLSDMISKFGTTDIPDEMYLVHSRKRLWEDWQFFLDRSPIRYVEQARTPLLIMHGEQDTRVHPSQSLELYRHLKTLGKAPVRLVLYKGEGHGNRKAAARYDYNVRMLQWFEHYLQGPGGDPPAYDIDYGRDVKDENGEEKKDEKDEEKKE
jgi:dipeptidyl aminopeptidase/acylaminoacyl peptidase